MNDTTQCFSGKWENLLLFSGTVFVVIKKTEVNILENLCGSNNFLNIDKQKRVITNRLAMLCSQISIVVCFVFSYPRTSVYIFFLSKNIYMCYFSAHWKLLSTSCSRIGKWWLKPFAFETRYEGFKEMCNFLHFYWYHW